MINKKKNKRYCILFSIGLICVLLAGYAIYNIALALVSFALRGTDSFFCALLLIVVFIDTAKNIYAVNGLTLEQIVITSLFSLNAYLIYLILSGLIIRSPLGNYELPSDKWVALIAFSVPLIVSISTNYIFVSLYMQKRFKYNEINICKYVNFIDDMAVYCTLFSLVSELFFNAELLSNNYCVVLCFYDVFLKYILQRLEKYRQKCNLRSKNQM